MAGGELGDGAGVDDDDVRALVLEGLDLGVVRLIADTVTVMRHGTVVESGPTAQILDDPTDEYTRRLVDSVPGSHLFL